MARKPHNVKKIEVISTLAHRTKLYNLGAVGGKKISDWHPQGQDLQINTFHIGTKLNRSIAVIGDIHADERSVDSHHLELLTQELQNLENIWFYAFVGDYINDNQEALLPALGKMIASLSRPVIAVMGNHDHRNDIDQIIQTFQTAGAIVLQNENISLDGIPIVGIDCWTTKHNNTAQALQGVAGDYIVLGHEPVLADTHDGYLHIAGHTHHGQIGYKKGLFTPRGSRPYRAGKYDLPFDRFVYTTSGIGYSVIHARINAHPEIAVLEV